MATSQPDRRTPSMSLAWESICVGVILIAAFCVAFTALMRTHSSKGAKDGPLQKTDLTPEDILTPDSYSFGSQDARTKLILFGDYECPPCRAEWPIVVNFVSTHPGVSLYFRNFPLVTIHPSALQAATVAELAKKESKYFAMQQLLYHSDLNAASLTAAVKKLGIKNYTDENAWMSARQAVVRDLNVAGKLGMTSTPTLLFIDRNSTVYQVTSLESLEPFIP